MVSSMGAWTMPQLVFAAAIGGSEGTDVLKPASTTAAGNLIIPQDECERAVKKFLGHDPPHNAGLLAAELVATACALESGASWRLRHFSLPSPRAARPRRLLEEVAAGFLSGLARLLRVLRLLGVLRVLGVRAAVRRGLGGALRA